MANAANEINKTTPEMLLNISITKRLDFEIIKLPCNRLTDEREQRKYFMKVINQERKETKYIVNEKLLTWKVAFHKFTYAASI